ncbi:hypothetical protein CEUSTIGMA_g8500.t1 [Chlamydomonas eustigma]|uniref:Uncharacterized protein n=1 Tax=Chlamydomonas eustigma TaxID=1157962 RepID=A0A250XDB6_9CHLO|nr:hypothetical protein CEUSTIGMA_g8500.t1 [Chlamydomonas eustigma]|eukprot:GAX81065.1 hypothetical protein CEUSTIGMA_g8500.t1 [Chlamydomonas eustigma]
MQDIDNVALKPQWLPGSRGKSSLLTSGTSNPLPEKHGSSGTVFTPLKHPARIPANLNASEEGHSNFKKTATVESSSARWTYGEARPQLQASEKISTTDLKPLNTNAVLLTNRHAGATPMDLQHRIASSDRDTWRSSPRKTYPHHKTKALSSDETSNEQSFAQSSTACVQGNLSKEDFPTLSANSAASVHPQEETSSSRHHAAFLSSRIPEHWTSRLAEPETVHVAEAPCAALSATKPQSSVCTSRSVAASDERNVKVASRTSADSCTLPSGSPSSQSTPSVLSSTNAWTAVSQPEKMNSQLPWEDKEIAVSSFPSATASTAAVGAAPTRSSFAQAASSSLLKSVVRQSKLGVGSVGPDSSHLSDQQLREKLAVKKSRQLVPLLARKEESSFSSVVSTGSGSSKQKGAVLGGSGVNRWLGGKVQKVVPSASHGSTAAAAAAAAAPVVLPLRGVAVAEMLPNGTMMLTKKSSLIPLDKPLIAAHTPSPASVTPAACSNKPPSPERPQPITESTEGGDKLSWMGLQQIADEEKIVGCLGMGQADDQKAGACPDDISEGGKNYEDMPIFKGEATSAAWNPFLHSPAPTLSTCMSQQATTFLLNDDSQVIPPPALDCHHLSSHIPPLSLLEALSYYSAKAITKPSCHSHLSPLLSSHLIDTTCSFSPEPQLSSGGPTQCTSPALPHLSQLPPSNATLHQVLDEGLEFAEMCSLLPCDLLGPALPVVFNAPSSRHISSPSSAVHKPCMNGELLLSRQSGSRGGGCLHRVLESPEEEEEAFLRSMGWTDVEGEQDVALTDEEVAAFMSKVSALSVDKTTQALSGSLNASLVYDAPIPVRRGLWNDGLTMLRSSSNQVATVACDTCD